MDLSGFVVMDTSTYLVFFERSIEYVHLDVCYICLNVISTFFTLVNNIKQLCNLCWKTKHTLAQYFNTLFSPLKFQIQTPCPNAICAETEHDLQETLLSVGFHYEGAPHLLTTRQPTGKGRNQKPCFQAWADSFQDYVSKNAPSLKKHLADFLCDLTASPF